MKNENQFDDAISAYENIKILKQTLKSENEAIDVEIAEAKKELDWLQTSYLPLDDLKESIIQLLNVSGQNYEMTSIRPAIKDLATNMKWGVGFPIEEFGKPITYKNIEKTISGNMGLFQASQIFTPDKSMFFDDRAFLALLFKVIEPTIRGIMERMTSEEFGYGGIRQSEVGPCLKERREMIQSIKEKIQELEHKKSANVQRLHALS